MSAFAQRSQRSRQTSKLRSLVSVHGAALGVAAQLAVRRGADGPAATAVATGSAALLQGQELLGTEGLVVDLAGGLDQVLEVGAGQEVAEVDKFTVVLILDVDDTPAVLTAANLLAVHDDGLLTTDNGERNDILTQKVNIEAMILQSFKHTLIWASMARSSSTSSSLS